jgi:hypothetical protein
VVVNAINYRTKWSNEEKDELRKLHASGKTDQEIANLTGRTRFAIVNMRDKLGLAHGQVGSNDRIRATTQLMISTPMFENITKAEARAIREWALCPDKEYPNVNLLNTTALPKFEDKS